MAVSPVQKEQGTQLSAHDVVGSAQRALGKVLHSAPWIVTIYLAAACADGPVAPPAIANTPILPPPGQPTLEIPTLTIVPTIVPTPTETPVPQWFLPEVAQLRALFTDSARLTDRQGGRSLLARQGDASEFEGAQVNNLSDVMRNGCGPAVIASFVRMFTHARDGVAAPVTVGSIAQWLQNNTYELDGVESPFLLPDGQMYMSAFQKALAQKGEDVFEVSEITPSVPLAGDFLTAVTMDQRFVARLQEVISQGGVVTFLGMMPYGEEGAIVAHIMGLTDIFWDEERGDAVATIIDPKTGFLTTAPFSDYLADYTFAERVYPYAVAAFTGVVPLIPGN